MMLTVLQALFNGGITPKEFLKLLGGQFRQKQEVPHPKLGNTHNIVILRKLDDSVLPTDSNREHTEQ